MKPEVVNKILDLYKKHGDLEYGEGFSVNAHSIQSGMLAKQKEYSTDLILAAFLHDIGHISALEEVNDSVQSMGEYGIVSHEDLGADYLKNLGFEEKITTPIKNHVASKRYFCAVDSEYYDKLSTASKKTLEYQDGKMSAAEIKAFQEDPFFEDSLALRKIDDQAKDENFQVTTSHWDFLRKLLLA